MAIFTSSTMSMTAALWIAAGGMPTAGLLQPALPQPSPAQPAQQAPAQGQPGGTNEPLRTTVRVVDGPFATADELLAELERADESIRTLRADIRYDRVFLEGDRQIRTGTLFFSDDKGASNARRQRMFAVTFQRLRLGNRVENEEKTYLFDGRWLVESTPSLKQIVRREIVREGDAFDPLKIGEGPLPLPIGQKREDILARFDATLSDPTEGIDGADEAEERAFRQFVEGSTQLRLVPKAGSAEAESFEEIRLWYRVGQGSEGVRTLLPRMARTVTRTGDVSVVQLINVTTNQPLPSEVMRPRQTPAGWEEIVHELPPAERR